MIHCDSGLGENQIKQYRNYVATIKTFDEVCNVSILGPNVLCTFAHGSHLRINTWGLQKKVVVSLADSTEVTCRIVRIDKTMDIMFLEPIKPLDPAKYSPKISTVMPTQGMHYYQLGGKDRGITTGFVSSTFPNEHGQIIGGVGSLSTDSGSPILNDEGQIIGMCCGIESNWWRGAHHAPKTIILPLASVGRF